MTEIESITWKDIAGNKFNCALHPAMLCTEKYHRLVTIRRIGDENKNLFKVEYDEEYAIEWVQRKLCQPLAILGKDRVFELLNKAYEMDAQLPILLN